jgi:hypothetical protein
LFSRDGPHPLLASENSELDKNPVDGMLATNIDSAGRIYGSMQLDPSKLDIAELCEALEKRGCDVSGCRGNVGAKCRTDLVNRLTQALAEAPELSSIWGQTALATPDKKLRFGGVPWIQPGESQPAVNGEVYVRSDETYDSTFDERAMDTNVNLGLQVAPVLADEGITPFILHCLGQGSKHRRCRCPASLPQLDVVALPGAQVLLV